MFNMSDLFPDQFMLDSSLFEDDSRGGNRLSHQSSDKMLVSQDPYAVDEQSLLHKLDSILAKNKMRKSEQK
jgi:hypothetical protein